MSSFDAWLNRLEKDLVTSFYTPQRVLVVTEEVVGPGTTIDQAEAWEPVVGSIVTELQFERIGSDD